MILEFTRIIIVLPEYMVRSDDAIGTGLGETPFCSVLDLSYLNI